MQGVPLTASIRVKGPGLAPRPSLGRLQIPDTDSMASATFPRTGMVNLVAKLARLGMVSHALQPSMHAKDPTSETR